MKVSLGACAMLAGERNSRGSRVLYEKKELIFYTPYRGAPEATEAPRPASVHCLDAKCLITLVASNASVLSAPGGDFVSVWRALDRFSKDIAPFL